MSQAFPPRPALSRRDFLASASALAAVPLLGRARWPGAAPAVLPAHHADVLRVGLIGCGGRGTGAAAQALRAENGTVVLTAMADVFADRLEGSLQHLAEALGPDAGRIQVPPEQRFTGFDAAARVIASDVHVILLATPPHFRPAHLKAAIAAGKHVFCEKPMAVDAPGLHSVMETAELARQKQLSLVAGFCWRYSRRHRELYQRIHDGALGDIRAVYNTYLASPLATHARQAAWSDMEFQLRNWQTFCWLSGDHIAEQAVHSLDKQAWTFGDELPLSCVGVGGNAARDYPERGDAFDHFGVTFDYAGGAKAFHISRQIAAVPTDNRDWIWGTKGDARVEGWSPLQVITGVNAWEAEGDDNDMYQQEHDELFASIRKQTPINDGVWMARSTGLALMARMAAYTGQVVTWEQMLASKQRLGPEKYEFGAAPAVSVAVPGKTQLV
jgi:myo-inositol 2-dehydrogenase / D-chiro-inositol 1-dehydrogenase